MTNAKLKARVAELGAEVAGMKAQVEELTPKANARVEKSAKNRLFETDREFTDCQRIMRNPQL